MKRALQVLLWPVRSLWRIVILGWLVGFGVVGSAALALAAPDQGPIPGPDLAKGAALTVFEQAPWYGYSLPTFAGSPNLGWPEQVMWAALNLITMILNLISAALIRGALVAMQWMLNLTLYRDNVSEIDTATQGVSNAVFWPLIGCTLATAGFTMYARARRDGNGSILGEAIKVAMLGILAITFAAAPSQIVTPLDDARTAASNAIMTGYSSDHLATGGSAAGFAPVAVPDTPDGASRSLADGLWNTFVLTPWCYTAWGGLDTCKTWGAPYITDDDKWKAVEVQIVGADKTNDLDAGSAPDFCVTTFGAACDSVRGTTITRVGSALVAALVAIPLALLLIALTIFGLLAAIGVLFLAMMAPLFVVGWLIPGLPRTIGLKWFQALIGCMIQSALIAALLGVVMVLGAIFQAMIPTYGFWMVGLLNLVVMIMAVRVRSMFENITGLSHPAAGGLVSSYVAMKALGSLGRMGKRVGHVASSAASRTGRGLATAAGTGSGGFMNAGSRGLQPTTAAPRGGRLRQHFHATTDALAMSGAMAAKAPRKPATATPYRGPQPSQQAALPAAAVPNTPGAGPARPMALPSATPPARRALPAAASNLATPTNAPATGRPPAPATPARRGIPAQPQAAPRTFASASTSTPGPVRSAQRQIALPSRRNIQTPPWRGDPLVITRLPQPVTPKAQLQPARRPVQPRATTPRAGKDGSTK